MREELETELNARVLDHGEHAFQHTAVARSVRNGRCDEVGSFWMTRMRFHDDRTAGSKSRGCVSSRHRKCQREIAGAKNCDRTQREEHPAKVGFRDRLPVRKCGINPSIYPRPLAHETGEHPKLVHSTSSLTDKAIYRKRGFLGAG